MHLGEKGNQSLIIDIILRRKGRRKKVTKEFKRRFPRLMLIIKLKHLHISTRPRKNLLGETLIWSITTTSKSKKGKRTLNSVKSHSYIGTGQPLKEMHITSFRATGRINQFEGLPT